MIKKIWIIWTIVGLVVIIIWFIFQYRNINTCEENYRKEKLEEYYGIVDRKYVDQYNHSFKLVKLKFRTQIRTLHMNSDLSGLFEYIEKGDSLAKQSGQYDVEVYRDGELSKIFKINYDCP